MIVVERKMGMSSEYKFKMHKKVYETRGKSIECFFAYYDAFVNFKDICRLYSITEDTLREYLKVIYKDMLKEEESHYVFRSWDDEVVDYYNLDTVLSISFLTDNNKKDVNRFLVWMSKKLRSYLVRLDYSREKGNLDTISDELDFKLPKVMREPKVCFTTFNEKKVSKLL